jgi:hypothetical protein
MEADFTILHQESELASVDAFGFTHIINNYIA